ncbi:MAG TPA: glycosyl hydrolase [Candidatus Limnocylindrales bacterium]|nr:glycosyl hydrolase [Candidatus Limnocylindrales bacterium]
MTLAASARIAWFATVGAATERDREAPTDPLPPPEGVRAVQGRGHVTVDWSPVDGAIGYLVHRGPAADGPFAPIDQHTGDLLAVPIGPYLDTTGALGAEAWYAVSSLPTIETEGGILSPPVAVRPGRADAAVAIDVDAGHVVGRIARPWRPIIGSEHLALLRHGPGPGGHDVGAELAEAFRIVRTELGVEAVRAHAILDDSLAVYRETDTGPVHDFALVDDVLARLLDTGLRPIVELSFMPRDLAAEPEATVFSFAGVISPPRDLDRWTDLVRDLVSHLADRFGRAEVRRWAFEIWNEPNLGLFWSGTQSDYFRLYDASVRAVKSVDSTFRVGGPATAAAGWIDDLLEHCRADEVPIDFISTHTYGMAPLDLRPIVARYGRPDLPLWWTEWGVSSHHGAPINDSAWAAPLVARGMRSAAGRLHALAYWVASDHFVELGEAPALFHGGFGLLTIGNLRKPRFWALAMLNRLGDDELACELDGDGAASLVEAWASADPDGRVAIAVWSGTLDQTRADGEVALDRSISLTIRGLGAATYQLRHHRVDTLHSNIVRTWEDVGRPDWPDADGWARLRAADRLETLGPTRAVAVDGGRLELAFDLPMPAMSLIELVPD